MNALDIIPPDFKLTGTWNLSVEGGGDNGELTITKQRKIIPQDFTPDKTSKLTPYMQINIDKVEYNDMLTLIDSVPEVEKELFIAALGRKDYMDEVLLSIILNDRGRFLNRVNSLYKRLVVIIDNVMKLTAGTKGSRRHIYQYYFFTKNSTPKEGDGILKGLIGMQLTSLVAFENGNFKKAIADLRNELVALYGAEDIPIIDLIDLTIEQFNIILRLLPKESAWLKARKERSTFFDTISMDLDKLGDIADKYRQTKSKFDNLSKKNNDTTISLEELQVLYDLQKKGVIYTIPQKINALVNTLNVFTMQYNANGILKYRGKALTQSASLINDLLNSQFMTFLQTFKSQHKKVLIKSITKVNVEMMDVDQPTSKVSQPTSTVDQPTTSIGQPNDQPNYDAVDTQFDTKLPIMVLVAQTYNSIYKYLPQSTITAVYEDKLGTLRYRINLLKKYVADPKPQNTYFISSSGEMLLTSMSLDILKGDEMRYTINRFHYLLSVYNNVKLALDEKEKTKFKDVLTLVSTLIPFGDASAFTEYTDISDFSTKYGPIMDDVKQGFT